MYVRLGNIHKQRFNLLERMVSYLNNLLLFKNTGEKFEKEKKPKWNPQSISCLVLNF